MRPRALPEADFWRGKRVMVTGHTGFKGAWTCLWLRRLGAELFGLALAPDPGESLFADCFAEDALAGQLGDIRDLPSVVRAFEQAKPEIVIHMAAQAIVRRSVADSIATFATNVMGTAHVLEAVRRCGSVRAIVNVTSDKCYRNNEWVWPYREIDPLGGRDPYSASKACAELVGQAFRETYFAPASKTFLASGRAGNVVGGGDWAHDRLIPDCIRAFRRKEPVIVRNPRSVRPWQHVLEPVAGYLLLAQRLYEKGHAFADAWNFAPESGNATPVSEVVDLCVRRWGGTARAEMTASSETAESVLLQVDSSKARALLGWRPRLDLQTTIDWTVNWYKSRADGEPAAGLCIEQIDRYEGAETSAD